MNTHPEKWYIQLTPENYDEVSAWWLKQVEQSDCHIRYLNNTCIVLSVHPNDNTYCWIGDESYLNKSYPSYKKITLEQFRQITKPMNTLPTKWYIEVTEENRDELDRWRQRVATSHRDNELRAYQHTILSRHLVDGSCYYANPVKDVREHEDYEDYQEITLEQFRQITNPNKPMTKSIKISRDLLNEYYDAATTPQREYLSEHFKLDGTTTEEAIRGLHEMACSTWKRRIMKNHPECFPEDSKCFDFSNRLEEHGSKGLVSNDIVESLGIRRDFIQIRRSDNPKTNARSFYLTTDYNWELVQDGTESGGTVWVLIPTKK